MVSKKKPFINKKKSSTYHLLHRSQRDVTDVVLDDNHHNGTTATTTGPQDGMVLWPSNGNTLADTDTRVLHSLSASRAKLQAAGLLDVDHERYLKAMTGTGTFLDAASGRPVEQTQANTTTTTTKDSANVDRNHTTAEDSLLEVPRHHQVDAIPLLADCMDDDIAALLEGDFDEGDFEELHDDFILDAAKEFEDAEEAFDFDVHIQALLDKAKRERGEDGNGAGVTDLDHVVGQQDRAYFSGLSALHEGRNEEEEEEDTFDCGDYGTVATEPGVVAKLSPDEERALCEKFEATLAEYDSDHSEYGTMLGDIPEQDIRGDRPLEGDAVIEAAMDDFLLERDDDVFIQGIKSETKRGGSGFSVLVGNKMIPAKELDNAVEHPEQEPVVPFEILQQQARETLAIPKQQPPAEEIFIDGKSYFSERERNPWDCESILSTYSNLDNNPTTIDASSNRRNRRRRKETRKYIAEEEPQHIRLSAKTGLPIGVLDPHQQQPPSDNDDDDGLDDTIVSVNRGVARNKKETSQEKATRKALVKRERELARIQKKMTREVFQEEFQKRAMDVSSNEMAGKTVFRFS